MILSELHVRSYINVHLFSVLCTDSKFGSGRYNIFMEEAGPTEEDRAFEYNFWALVFKFDILWKDLKAHHNDL